MCVNNRTLQYASSKMTTADRSRRRARETRPSLAEVDDPNPVKRAIARNIHAESLRCGPQCPSRKT